MNAARAVALLALLPAALAGARDLPTARLRVPAGFKVEVYAADVPAARGLALGDDGTVFVGSNTAGKVYALVDSDHDGHADKTHVLASDLQLPVGVAFHDGALYVSAVSRILRLDGIEKRLADPPDPVVVRDDLPSETHHGWRFIAFGPDNKLYVPIGAPCNVCDRPGYAKLTRMNADGSGREDVAYGIRNTVGFAWHPRTKELWFTDNGRDLLGDDLPSDELDHVQHAGQHFGFPYCHQGDTLDPEFGQDKHCSDYVAPVLKLGAHVAAIGLRFYTGTQFPAQYRDAMFIAEHGSWNRSKKVGYRVVSVRLDGEKVLETKPFLEGFLDNEQVYGRPSDVLVMPDGALLVSDDLNGAVYRVSWRGDASAPKDKE